MYTYSQKQASKPYKLLNTHKLAAPSSEQQKQLVGLVLLILTKQPQQKQRKYINALVPA